MTDFIHTLRAGAATCPPLFCIHPVSGDAGALQELASHSRYDAAWIGVDDPALHDEPLAITLDERAGRYAEAIATRTPGPIHLFGWSTGGVIAAEVSERLRAKGREIGRLIVIDSRVPQPEMRLRDVTPPRVRSFFVEVSTRGAGLEPPESTAYKDTEAVATALRSLGMTPETHRVALAQRIEIFASNLRTYFMHEPHRISSRVILFETEDEHPQHPRPATLGWEDIAASIERCTTPGTHFTAVFGSHAAALAHNIDQFLAG